MFLKIEQILNKTKFYTIIQWEVLKIQKKGTLFQLSILEDFMEEYDFEEWVEFR